MTYPLIASLIGLNNTATTLVNDLYQADVDGVTLEMTKNTGLLTNLVDEDWFAVVKAGDYTMLFGAENIGKLTAFDKTLDESIEPLTGFMDEDEAENFINEIRTLPQRIKDITEQRKALLDNPREIQKQQVIAMMISQWYIVLRWLEDAEVIGLDEAVVFAPIFTLGDGPTLTIENNILSAVVDLTDGVLTVAGTALTGKNYIETALKDEGRDDAMYYAGAAIEAISNLSKKLAELV